MTIIYCMGKKKTATESTGASTRAVTALAFLQQPEKHINTQTPPAAIAVYGDEPFLRLECLQTLRKAFLAAQSGEEDESPVTVYSNSTPEFSKVKLELTTVSMFGPQSRVAIVEQADDFVKSYRDKIEELITEQAYSGSLILELSSLPSNVRLYKIIAEKGLLLDCKSLSEELLASWLIKRAAAEYKSDMQREAAETLVDKIGDSMGLLNQELAKLATYANGQPITCQMVNTLSGSWRAQTAWVMLDCALAGYTDSTLKYLDSLLAAGEVPIVIAAQLAANLRKLAMANRLFLDAQANGRRISLNEALTQVGVKPFVIRKSQDQLQRLGVDRVSQLLDWLTQLDFDLKGDSRLDARTLLERFLLQLSR